VRSRVKTHFGQQPFGPLCAFVSKTNGGDNGPDSSFTIRMMPALHDRPPTRLRLRVIPALIGIVAVLNVASVVLALIE
jgi:hypothetical protein